MAFRSIPGYTDPYAAVRENRLGLQRAAANRQQMRRDKDLQLAQERMARNVAAAQQSRLPQVSYAFAPTTPVANNPALGQPTYAPSTDPYGTQALQARQENQRNRADSLEQAELERQNKMDLAREEAMAQRYGADVGALADVESQYLAGAAQTQATQTQADAARYATDAEFEAALQQLMSQETLASQQMGSEERIASTQAEAAKYAADQERQSWQHTADQKTIADTAIARMRLEGQITEAELSRMTDQERLALGTKEAQRQAERDAAEEKRWRTEQGFELDRFNREYELKQHELKMRQAEAEARAKQDRMKQLMDFMGPANDPMESIREQASQVYTSALTSGLSPAEAREASAAYIEMMNAYLQ